MNNLTIAVLYGGKSVEHEVSIHSAGDVCKLLAKKFNVLHIYIDKQGKWFLQQSCGTPAAGDLQVTPVLGKEYPLQTIDGKPLHVDVFFPVLHGTKGEDGTMQGLFDLLETPYVGCGVLTSAMGMDKVISKIVAQTAGVPTLPYIRLEADYKYDKILEDKAAALGLPVFVKPVSLGSSVGVTKVSEISKLKEAIDFAFKFDTSIMIEKGVDKPREIFCAVYGGGDKINTSPCGELIPNGHEFFDYFSKYIDPNGCIVKVPAQVSAGAEAKMQQYSDILFRELRGVGLARVDYLVAADGGIYFSEINTLPGMSDTSLFPQLWRAAGKDYGQILEELVMLAVKRTVELKKLQTDKE
ncbi:D-alanine-D-alanine ligase [Elusimicrobium simillimum]|uniref:D-alanine--D-alanine ligase family protein n=1 Tax=Elusimicrobium simillimum TaxID=3143438 RepID=UPI003C6F2500